MNILGISCFYHDSSAALVRDGQLIAASAEERNQRSAREQRGTSSGQQHSRSGGHVAFLQHSTDALISSCLLHVGVPSGLVDPHPEVRLLDMKADSAVFAGSGRR